MEFSSYFPEIVGSFLGVILGFIIGVWYENKKEKEYRKEVIRHYLSLFSDELKANKEWIEKRGFILRQYPENDTSKPVLYLPLSTGMWQTLSGTSDLKYVDEKVLKSILWAYTKINDFNDFLIKIENPILFIEDEAKRNIILSKYAKAFNKLKEDAIKEINKALKEIENFKSQ